MLLSSSPVSRFLSFSGYLAGIYRDRLQDDTKSLALSQHSFSYIAFTKLCAFLLKSAHLTCNRMNIKCKLKSKQVAKGKKKFSLTNVVTLRSFSQRTDFANPGGRKLCIWSKNEKIQRKDFKAPVLRSARLFHKSQKYSEYCKCAVQIFNENVPGTAPLHKS